MNSKAEQLYQQALELPRRERVALAERLLKAARAEPAPTGDDLRALEEAIEAAQVNVDAGRFVPADSPRRELD